MQQTSGNRRLEEEEKKDGKIPQILGQVASQHFLKILGQWLSGFPGFQCVLEGCLCAFLGLGSWVGHVDAPVAAGGVAISGHVAMDCKLFFLLQLHRIMFFFMFLAVRAWKTALSLLTSRSWWQWVNGLSHSKRIAVNATVGTAWTDQRS